MRISRLFVEKPLAVGKRIELDDDCVHYIRDVLRLKTQQNIVLFNGTGGEYLCRLSEVNRKTVSAEIEKYLDRDLESPLSVSLGMGISRGDRMDWAIQKAVELGVNRLTPVLTERCVIKFDTNKKLQRISHWQNIVRHAAEQSGRTRLPTLGEITDIAEWADQQRNLKLFLDPNAGLSMADIKPESPIVTLLSGPEGGFSPNEKHIAISAGFIPVKIGVRILRTETAILAALTAVQTLWGDFH